jgi:hypothetical protein
MPIAQKITARIDKWDCIRFKSSTIKGNNFQNQETAHRMGENLYQILLR